MIVMIIFIIRFLSICSESDCSLKSCYGAKPNHVCCDTCNDIRQAYYDKGWFFRNSNFAQCQGDEGKYFGSIGTSQTEKWRVPYHIIFALFLFDRY